jgi:hypothetical protein
MQAKTKGLTHTPPNPPTLGDFELAFVVWSKPRVPLPPKLGGWGGHLRANLNFSKSVHHEHLHAENDRAESNDYQVTGHADILYPLIIYRIECAFLWSCYLAAL